MATSGSFGTTYKGNKGSASIEVISYDVSSADKVKVGVGGAEGGAGVGNIGNYARTGGGAFDGVIDTSSATSLDVSLGNKGVDGDVSFSSVTAGDGGHGATNDGGSGAKHTDPDVYNRVASGGGGGDTLIELDSTNTIICDGGAGGSAISDEENVATGGGGGGGGTAGTISNCSGGSDNIGGDGEGSGTGGDSSDVDCTNTLFTGTDGGVQTLDSSVVLSSSKSSEFGKSSVRVDPIVEAQTTVSTFSPRQSVGEENNAKPTRASFTPLESTPSVLAPANKTTASFSSKTASPTEVVSTVSKQTASFTPKTSPIKIKGGSIPTQASFSGIEGTIKIDAVETFGTPDPLTFSSTSDSDTFVSPDTQTASIPAISLKNQTTETTYDVKFRWSSQYDSCLTIGVSDEPETDINNTTTTSDSNVDVLRIQPGEQKGIWMYADTSACDFGVSINETWLVNSVPVAEAETQTATFSSSGASGS